MITACIQIMQGLDTRRSFAGSTKISGLLSPSAEKRIKKTPTLSETHSTIRSHGPNKDSNLQTDSRNNHLIMSLGGILSTITSSLVRLNYASAPNSTNFGAHEVAKAKVSLQEEGGVHIFEFHIPTDGAGAALLALAAVAVIVIAIIAICCWCGVKCTQVCCNYICPCAAFCRRRTSSRRTPRLTSVTLSRGPRSNRTTKRASRWCPSKERTQPVSRSRMSEKKCMRFMDQPRIWGAWRDA